MAPQSETPGTDGTARGGQNVPSTDDSNTHRKPKGGKSQRRKGDRIEREIVDLHQRIGVHAERVPLSGAAHYKNQSHDIDVMAFGRDEVPLCCEVKSRQNGAGFATIARWLADNDALFLRENNAAPIVVLPFRIWELLLSRVARR